MGILDALTKGLDSVIKTVNEQATGAAAQGGQSDTITGLLNSLGKELGYAGNAVSEQQTINRFLTEVSQQTIGLDPATDRSKILQIQEALLRKYGADRSPDSKLGRLYQSIKPMLDRSVEPVAHSRCIACCGLSRELCSTCLPLRLDALEAISLLDDPEAYREKYYVKGKAKATTHASCTFCGGPLEPGAAVCSYCGTAISGVSAGERVEVNSAAEIPSAVENALDAVYRYTSFTSQHKDTKEFLRLMVDLSPIEGSIKQLTSDRMSQLERLSHQKMTEQTAMQAAQEQGLSMSAYLRALMDDNAENYAVMTFNKEMKRQKAAEQQRHAQAMAAQQQAYETQRRNNAEYWERQRSIHRPGEYSGGSGINSSDRHCCGTCEKYMPALGQCSLNQIRRSATEYCGSYRQR